MFSKQSKGKIAGSGKTTTAKPVNEAPKRGDTQASAPSSVSITQEVFPLNAFSYKVVVIQLWFLKQCYDHGMYMQDPGWECLARKPENQVEELDTGSQHKLKAVVQGWNQ